MLAKLDEKTRSMLKLIEEDADSFAHESDCFNSWAWGFSVALDPLDGSSIVHTNFTVGTIFGVWPGDKLNGVTRSDQVAAAMGIFEPRTTYVLSLKDCPGTHQFLLLDEGKWQHVKDTTEIGEGKMFSPGNLRDTFDNPNYAKASVQSKLEGYIRPEKLMSLSSLDKAYDSYYETFETKEEYEESDVGIFLLG